MGLTVRSCWDQPQLWPYYWWILGSFVPLDGKSTGPGRVQGAGQAKSRGIFSQKTLLIQILDKRQKPSENVRTMSWGLIILGQNFLTSVFYHLLFYFLYNLSYGRIVYFRRTPYAQSFIGITDSI